MGFSDQELVALSGAHALGYCHKDLSGYVGAWTFSVPLLLTPPLSLPDHLPHPLPSPLAFSSSFPMHTSTPV